MTAAATQPDAQRASPYAVRPLTDSEFANSPAPGVLVAGPSSPAAGHMDLLTVVMHELGHVIEPEPPSRPEPPPAGAAPTPAG